MCVTVSSQQKAKWKKIIVQVNKKHKTPFEVKTKEPIGNTQEKE